MDGFGLLMGHLIGDYIVQNDWMAANKSAWSDWKNIEKVWGDAKAWRDDDGTVYPKGTTPYHNAMVDEYVRQCAITQRGHFACTVHCLLYTLSVAACSFWWLPWWGLLICFAVHWPIDRFRLARLWMERISGQKAFATGPLSPWSIIVVDNVFHLLTLFLIALIARPPL